MTRTIVHLSHSGLPDARIERIATLLQSYGRQVFLGPQGKQTTLLSDSFNTIITTQAFSTPGNLGLPLVYHRLRRQINRIIRRINPVLIYAHNIIAAKIASDLSVPFVYDDHEYWSRQATLRRIGHFSGATRLKNIGRYFLAPHIWRKWETQILASSIANITVSEAIAREHRRRGKDCSVIPNLPLMRELVTIKTPALQSGQLRAISLASDFQGFQEHRQPGDNLEVWEKEGGILMDWVGRPPPPNLRWIRHRRWIEPSQLLQVLTSDYQVGFIPWTKNWYHRYSLPSKTAWYAHAGLLFVLSSDYASLIEFLPEEAYFAFTNPSELCNIIRKLLSFSPDKILAHRMRVKEWAENHAILDQYKPILGKIMNKVE
ncbi:MAG: glycosyltransferase [Promethearchaeota archaeon]